VGGLNARTNLYYLETSDLAATWRNASGTAVTTPLTDPVNAALVHDYMSESRLVYLKDLAFDSADHPVILYLTGATSDPGPQTPTRMLHTARWTGTEWQIRDMIATDHNYDFGSLTIADDGQWRVIGTFFPGPQAFGTGGEIGIWTSANQGGTWQLERQVTDQSLQNHNYPRRTLNARDDFHALWADGNAFAVSPSRLYFTDRYGDAVMRLPVQMNGDFAFPEVVRVNDPTGDPDGDGANNENEFKAGTDPRDASSVLRVQAVGKAQGGGFQLTFGTRSGKAYQVLFAENLADGVWLVLADDVPGTGSPITIEDSNVQGEVQRFYRVQVKEP